MRMPVVLGLICVSGVSVCHGRSVIVCQGTSDASAAVAVEPNWIVVGDDENNAIRVYSTSGGMPAASIDCTEFLGVSPKSPEADIEGATRVGDRIYWIGSHGRNKDGKARSNRCRFFATQVRVLDGRVSIAPAGRVCKDLLAAMLSSESLMGLGLVEAAASGYTTGRKDLAPKDGGLNIEALAASADGKTLYIGFRNPIPRGRALVVPLENARAVIDEGRMPSIGRPLLWDLSGLGIRSMEYVAGIEAYFIVAGPHDEVTRFALFRWSGKAEDRPVKVQDLGQDLPDFNPEALTAFGKRLLILSDDGSRLVRPASPDQCMEGELLKDGRCQNKYLLDPKLKTFRAIELEVQ